MGDTIFDKYSFLHMGSGAVAYWLGFGVHLWFFLHFMFEVVENTETGMQFINEKLTWWPGGKDHPDDSINVLGDNISAVVGWWLAKKLNKYK